MKKNNKKLLISKKFQNIVPFNYNIFKFDMLGLDSNKQVVYGRKPQRTLPNKFIQNPNCKKAYFFKPISKL